MLGVIRPSSLSLGLLEIQAAGHHINMTGASASDQFTYMQNDESNSHQP